MREISIDPEAMADDLHDFAEIGRTSDGGVTRLGYTQREDEAHELMLAKLVDYDRHAKVAVCDSGSCDPIAYAVGKRDGSDKDMAPITIVSHLDSVPNGGRLDGTYGIVGGIAMLRALASANMRTKHPIRVAAFHCEESSRFGRAFIGSRITSGKFNLRELDTLKDHDGVTLRDAMAYGTSPLARRLEDRINDCPGAFGRSAAVLELHIEQGPVLDHRNLSLGVVTAIAKATRLRVTLTGRAAHSGTTPMYLRRDALVVAADVIGRVKRIADHDQQCRHTVATVGTIQVKPNAMNVVPAEVVLGIDIRNADDTAKDLMVASIRSAIFDAAQQGGIRVEIESLEDGPSVLMDAVVHREITKAALSIVVPVLNMVSGAGHDCMNFADQCPVGMIFVPSIGGVSHHHEERTDFKSLVHGANALLKTVLRLDEVLP